MYKDYAPKHYYRPITLRIYDALQRDWRETNVEKAILLAIVLVSFFAMGLFR